MTADLAAYLAAHTGPVRTWPPPTEPDHERWDDDGDDWPAGLDWSWPAPNKETAA